MRRVLIWPLSKQAVSVLGARWSGQHNESLNIWNIFGMYRYFVIVKFQNALGDVFSESYMDSGSIIIFSMSLTLNSQKYWP